jgi:KUP system potassium uptake protein
LTQIIPQTIIKIDFRLGFKVEPRINLHFKQVLDEMEVNNEIDLTSRYESLRKFNIDSDFAFVIIDRIPNYDLDFSPYQKFVIGMYNLVHRMGISEVKAFGLDTSNIIVEKVPLSVDKSYKRTITRRIHHGHRPYSAN